MKVQAFPVSRPSTNLVPDAKYQLTKDQKKSGFMGVFSWAYTGDPGKTLTKIALGAVMDTASYSMAKEPRAKTQEERAAKRMRLVALRAYEDQRKNEHLAQFTSLKKVGGDDPHFILRLPILKIPAGGLGPIYSLITNGAEVPVEAVESFAEVQASGERVFPVNQCLVNSRLPAATQDLFKQCLTGVVYKTGNAQTVVYLEFKINQLEAEALVSTDWLEIRPVDLYPMFTMWVEAEYVSKHYGKTAISLSKISRTLPPHEVEDRRVDQHGLGITLDGQPIYIPAECDFTEHYESRFASVGEMDDDGEFKLMDIQKRPTPPRLPANIPVLTDWVNFKFTYTNSAGRPVILPLENVRKCGASMALNILNREIDSKFLLRLNSYADIVGVSSTLKLEGVAKDVEEKKIINVLFRGKDTIDLRTYAQGLPTLDRTTRYYDLVAGDEFYLAPVRAFIQALYPAMEQNIEALYSKFAVSTVIGETALGMVGLMYHYGLNLAETTAESNKTRKAALTQGLDPSWTPPDMPLITESFSKEDGGLLPHQAKVRNLLRESPDFAVLSVDAGGGKSMLSITDVLYEIKAKRSAPYLIMCPGHLVANYVSELVEFTDGRLNVIPITSYNIRTTGAARIQSIVEAAPINTVLVVDYGALKYRAKSAVYGTTSVAVFPVVELIRKFRPGYCLTGDTLVHTNKGTVRLDKIASGLDIGERKDVNGWEVLTKEGLRPVVKAQRTRKAVKKITTNQGVEIKASGEHPFYVLTQEMTFEWIDAKDLVVGDILCVDRKNSHFNSSSVALNLSDVEKNGNYKRDVTKPEVMTPELARLLGYMVAEGYVDERQTSFSQNDPATQEDYSLCFQSVFGSSPKTYGNRVNSNIKEIVVWFTELGLGVRSRNQKVPSVVLRADKECQVEFLRGYFEGDAGVNGQYVTASSQSFRLLQQIQNMLLNLGIPSSVKRGEDVRFDPPKPSHRLSIKNREDIERFASTIGFLSEYRKDRLSNLLNHSQSRLELKGGRLVPGLKEFTQTVRDELGDGSGTWQLEAGGTQRMKVFWRAGPTKLVADSYETVAQTLALGNLELVSAEISARLSYIAEKGFLFDPVTSIEDIGTKDVYDIQVEGEQTFIANGVVVHNCMLDESHLLKNAQSATFKAVMNLITDIPKKRIASGTLNPDSPSDLPAQMAIMDPTIFGTREDFNNRYGAEVAGKRVIRWRTTGPNSVGTVMTTLKQNVVWCSAKRKEWACALPPRQDRFIAVQLSEEQRRVYNAIFDNMVSQIRKAAEKDANARALLDKLEGKKASKDDEDSFGDMGEADVGEDLLDDTDDVGPGLQPYLADIERYVTNPGFHPYARDGFVTAQGEHIAPLTGDDLKPPKAVVLEKLMREDYDVLNPNVGKTLIFVNYNESAESIYNAMPPDIKACGLLYSAANKTELVNQFKRDKKIRWMIGIRRSLEVGLNLQIASNLVRLEGVWTPGEQEQGDSRIARPYFGPGGDQRPKLRFDTIVADRTLDITKAARLRAKIVALAKFENTGNPNYEALDDIPIIPMRLESIQAMNDFQTNLAQYETVLRELNQITKDEYAEYRVKIAAEGGFKFTQVKQAPIPEGCALLARVPYAQGTELYKASELGLVRLDNYLGMELSGEDDEEDTGIDEDGENDVTSADVRNLVVGLPCHTEYGEGIVKGIVAPGGVVRRVHVTLNDGTEARSLRSTNVFIITRTETNSIDMRNKIAQAAGLEVTGDITVPGANIRQTKMTLKQQRALEKQKDAEIKERQRQQKLDQKAKKVSVALQLNLINGYLQVGYAGNDEKVLRALEGIGFKKNPQYYYTRIYTYKQLLTQAQNWADAGFHIGDKYDSGALAALSVALTQNGLQSHRHYSNLLGEAQFKNYMRETFRPTSDKDMLNMFALVTDGGWADSSNIRRAEKKATETGEPTKPAYGIAYLCLPAGGGQPGTRRAIQTKYSAPRTRWFLSDDMLTKFVKSLQGVHAVVEELHAAGINISNVDELNKYARSVKKVAPKTDDLAGILDGNDGNDEDEAPKKRRVPTTTKEKAVKPKVTIRKKART